MLLTIQQAPFYHPYRLHTRKPSGHFPGSIRKKKAKQNVTKLRARDFSGRCLNYKLFISPKKCLPYSLSACTVRKV